MCTQNSEHSKEGDSTMDIAGGRFRKLLSCYAHANEGGGRVEYEDRKRIYIVQCTECQKSSVRPLHFRGRGVALVCLPSYA